jgi:hypothetical protein
MSRTVVQPMPSSDPSSVSPMSPLFLYGFDLQDVGDTRGDTRTSMSSGVSVVSFPRFDGA